MRCFLGWVIWTKCWWYRRTIFMWVNCAGEHTYMHSSIIMLTTWLIGPYRTYLDELTRLCGEWYFSSDQMQYFSKLLNAVKRDSIAETLLKIFNSKSKLQSQIEIHYHPASFSCYMLVKTLLEKFYLVSDWNPGCHFSMVVNVDICHNTNVNNIMSTVLSEWKKWRSTFA